MIRFTPRHVLILATPMLAVLMSMTVHASDQLSAEEARQLMQQGEIRPLLELIRRHQFEGTLLDTELEREDGRLIYELEYLNNKGEVWEYELDARTGNILEQERED